jgi:hypothetical protein
VVRLHASLHKYTVHTFVTLGEPRHKEESRLIVVDMEAAVLDSAELGVPPMSDRAVEEAGEEDRKLEFGVIPDVAARARSTGATAAATRLPTPASFILHNSSSTSPFSANGAGSIPRRVKRSARDAKHLSAPSAT